MRIRLTEQQLRYIIKEYIVNNTDMLTDAKTDDEFAVCVRERNDNGGIYDRVVHSGSKESCDDYIKDYESRFVYNRGMLMVKPVDEVNNKDWQYDRKYGVDTESDSADLEDMIDQSGYAINGEDYL